MWYTTRLYIGATNFTLYGNNLAYASEQTFYLVMDHI